MYLPEQLNCLESHAAMYATYAQGCEQEQSLAQWMRLLAMVA
jgi:hypothetical protein